MKHDIYTDESEPYDHLSNMCHQNSSNPPCRGLYKTYEIFNIIRYICEWS